MSMSNKLFNTPFELSLHVIMLLDVVDDAITIDRIIAYDFISVYSEAFGIYDISLNGENRFAFSEMSTRRGIIKSAVKDLVLDRLIQVEDNESGTLYRISESGKKMSRDFQSGYAMQYKKIMEMIVQKYAKDNEVSLFDMINRQSTKSLRR